MIAKAGTSTNIIATLEYNENARKGGEVVFSHGIDPAMPVNLQARILEELHNTRYKVKAHTIVISHGDHDSKRLTKKDEERYLRAFLKGLESRGFDLDGCRWVIARHGNTNNIHYHMAIMTTKIDGSRFKDYYLGKNAARVAAEVSAHFELEKAEWAAKKESKHQTHNPKPKKKAEPLLDDVTKGKVKKYYNRKAAIAAAKERKNESEKNQTRKKSDRQTKLPTRHFSNRGGEEPHQRTGFRR